MINITLTDVEISNCFELYYKTVSVLSLRMEYFIPIAQLNENEVSNSFYFSTKRKTQNTFHTFFQK